MSQNRKLRKDWINSEERPVAPCRICGGAPGKKMFKDTVTGVEILKEIVCTNPECAQKTEMLEWRDENTFICDKHPGTIVEYFYGFDCIGCKYEESRGPDAK